jgi:hypothetical protein
MNGKKQIEPQSKRRTLLLESPTCVQPSSPSSLIQQSKTRSKIFPATQISYLNKQMPGFKKMMPKSNYA